MLFPIKGSFETKIKWKMNGGPFFLKAWFCRLLFVLFAFSLPTFVVNIHCFILQVAHLSTWPSLCHDKWHKPLIYSLPRRPYTVVYKMGWVICIYLHQTLHTGPNLKAHRVSTNTWGKRNVLLSRQCQSHLNYASRIWHIYVLLRYINAVNRKVHGSFRHCLYTWVSHTLLQSKMYMLVCMSVERKVSD